MKEVTIDEFYKAIGPLDVVLSAVGDYPYTTEFKMRNSGTIKGKVVDRIGVGDEDPLVSVFYLVN